MTDVQIAYVARQHLWLSWLRVLTEWSSGSELCSAVVRCAPQALLETPTLQGPVARSVGHGTANVRGRESPLISKPYMWALETICCTLSLPPFLSFCSLSPAYQFHVLLWNIFGKRTTTFFLLFFFVLFTISASSI